ncbi:putative transporter YycB [Thalassobacillus devorans]|uniref:Transporter YycB n=1 Tax=Thalassobacillus devorans TaxID=279813 RepID=A0ABQ1PF62_9BACI|nr:MFS transporter [Thalassobacillus devorans]GGC95971.1 putative transporter YycB [Thalassobacillus devorans]
MTDHPQQTKKLLFIIGVIFVAFNLRPAITGVGPLISSIRIDLGISYGAAGFITTLPLISFAVFSFLAPQLGNRFGYERMVFAGLVTLMLGISIRYIAAPPTLYTGTALVGIGIAISNVLLPGIIKGRYPGRIGLMTAVYTTSMSVFSAVGSGLSIPLVQGLGLGWEKALFAWILLAMIAALLWIPQLSRPVKNEDKTFARLSGPPIWQSKIAWQVTIFMGLQSFLFYSLITWLPEIMTGKGLGIAAAGWMVSTMQLAGLPMTFLTPVLADRFRNQRGLIIMIGVLYLTGLTGMLVSTTTGWLTGSVMLMGMGQASSISLALTLLGLRAANARDSAALSGMAQSFGYALAAIGPTLIGMILDVSATVITPIVIFIGILVVMIAAGLGATRNQTVFAHVKE